MNVIGLVAEYNPFHNGHLYQINKIKEMYPNSLIVCVCSSNFSQRGDISVLDKWQKTDIMLNNKIDIVLELPYFFTVQSADIFAHASLQILNEFKIDTLVFGTESSSLDDIINIANCQIDNKKYDNLVKKYLSVGNNYATSLSKAINDINGKCLNTPNDLLAISYIKNIAKNNYNINPINIKRTNDYHDTKSTNKIVSASNVREKYYNKINYKKYVPKCTYNYLMKNDIYNSLYFNLLKYKIITSNNLSKNLDVNEGIENKLKKVINNSNNLDELIKNIKSKRYTYSKIKRMLNHILLNLIKDDCNSIKNIEYIRVLGFNESGKNYLSSIKKNIKYEIINKYSKKYTSSDYELISTKIYSLLTNKNDLIKKEYKNTIIKI